MEFCNISTINKKASKRLQIAVLPSTTLQTQFFGSWCPRFPRRLPLQTESCNLWPSSVAKMLIHNSSAHDEMEDLHSRQIPKTPFVDTFKMFQSRTDVPMQCCILIEPLHSVSNVLFIYCHVKHSNRRS